MKFKPLVLVVLIFVSGIYYYNLTGNTVSEKIFSRVERVLDGDTIQLEGRLKVRLLGVNTPEKSMYLDEQAKNFLSNLVLDKTIMLESFGYDKYGRVLAYVFLEEQNVNELILKNGFGSLYYYDLDDYYGSMVLAEEFARLNEKGIWKKSLNADCLFVEEFETDEPERLVLKNDCDYGIDILIKDDATHIYRERILGGGDFVLGTSYIWNDGGDSLYVWDSEGLLVFYRY